MQVILSIAVFFGFAAVFIFANLLLGKLVRPAMPQAEKSAIYECGEVPVGSSWVQFDLRFYIVALFYLVFDVEVALLYAWAVVYRQMPFEAFVVGLPFIAVVVVGYAYEWWSGSLEWVRSQINTSRSSRRSAELSAMARRDPETLIDASLPGGSAQRM